VVTNLRCNNTASITGLQVPNGINYYWTDQNGNTISNQLDLIIGTPGKYQLHLAGGCITSDVYEIIDDRVVINDYSLVKTDVACGANNGSIKNLFAYDPLSKVSTETWKDGSGSVVGNTMDISNLSAGNYILTVNTSDGCSASYGPIVLKNTTGPNIDQLNIQVQSTNCGQATGSITNIGVTGTGTLKYSWTNDHQQQVGTDKDLLNQPAGTYKLQVTDDTQCGPIFTTGIVIPETNGITLDESHVVKTNAGCGQNNGSITNITQTGATKFTWTDANNKPVGNAMDLTGVPTGDYTLTVSNAFGCSKTSAVYHVDQQASVVFPDYSFNIKEACFGSPDGSITVSTDALVKSIRWVNSAGTDAGSQPLLPDVPAGNYQLYLTDANGCENYYKTFTVNQTPEYTVAGYGVVTADACNTGSGTVSATTITGGLPPYTYTWYNADKKQIGTGNSIANLASGVYTLNVVDTRCGDVDITYTVDAESRVVPAPSVSDIQLCSSGNALIMVNNAIANGLYKIYDDANSEAPMATETGGKFAVSANSSRSYFISQVNGTCESPRAEVKVTVGLSVVNIANTFTPNGDGINDYWKISNIENYPAAIVQVFTRYGQKVFESKGYSTPFNGTMGDKKLPAGVYYFIINLKSNCNILSGSLTIIR